MANSTAHADISLVEQTSYRYRVRATNWAGPSAYSNEASATTPALPLAPSNLTNATRVDLSWQDNSTNEAGFKVERQVVGSETWTQIATDVANTTAFADTTVLADTRYRYRVRAYDWRGDSPYSNVAETPTEADILIKDLVVSGNANYATAGSITVSGNVTVPNGASLNLQAGQGILFQPTFRVNRGGPSAPGLWQALRDPQGVGVEPLPGLGHLSPLPGPDRAYKGTSSRRLRNSGLKKSLTSCSTRSRAS